MNQVTCKDGSDLSILTLNISSLRSTCTDHHCLGPVSRIVLFFGDRHYRRLMA